MSYVPNSHISVVGFTNSDWAGNLTTRKSIEGCVFGLGYIGSNNELVTSRLIHWQAKSQSVIALSTLEAEYIACSHTTRESLWLKRMTKEAADGMSVQVSEGNRNTSMSNTTMFMMSSNEDQYGSSMSPQRRIWPTCAPNHLPHHDMNSCCSSPDW